MNERKPGDPVPLELQTATRARDGRPFVSLSLGSEQILMDPAEARSLGNMFIDYAGLAETEAATIRVMTAEGASEADAQGFLSLVTAERGKLRTETVH